MHFCFKFFLGLIGCLPGRPTLQARRVWSPAFLERQRLQPRALHTLFNLYSDTLRERCGKFSVITLSPCCPAARVPAPPTSRRARGRLSLGAHSAQAEPRRLPIGPGPHPQPPRTCMRPLRATPRMSDSALVHLAEAVRAKQSSRARRHTSGPADADPPGPLPPAARWRTRRPSMP
jgi:hypothetical protein